MHREVLQDDAPGGLVGGAAVAVSAAMGGVAQAGEREHRHPGFPRGRHGLLDLTHPLTTTIPPFAPGEEPERETVAEIDPDGYYMQEWTLIEHIGTHVDAPGTSSRAAGWRPSSSRRS